MSNNSFNNLQIISTCLKSLVGTFTILELPANNPNTYEKAKLTGTFEGAIWNTFPLPFLIRISLYSCFNFNIFDFLHQNPNDIISEYPFASLLFIIFFDNSSKK